MTNDSAVEYSQLVARTAAQAVITGRARLCGTLARSISRITGAERPRTSRHRVPLLRSSLLLLLSSATSISAQTSLVITDAETCPRCVIRLEPSLLLTAPDTAKGLTRYTVVAADRHGGYLLSDVADADYIALYDSVGRFVRTVGRRGTGPGEFESLSAIVVGPGDTIHAFGNHHTAFTWDGQYLHSEFVLNGAQVNRALFLPSGRLLLQAMIATPDLIGKPLHLTDTHGKVILSFGSLNGEYATGQFYERFRAVGQAGDGGFWSLTPNRYRLAHWTASGDLTLTAERTCSWCGRWDRWEGDPTRAEPPPIYTSLAEDTLGRVWVLTAIGDRDWVPSRAPMDRRDAPVPSLSRDDGLWDTIIEVLDVTTGKLIKSQRFRMRYRAFLDAGRVWRLEEDEFGEIHVRILRATLIGG